MKEREIRIWLAEEAKPDRWRVSLDGELGEGSHSLDGIFALANARSTPVSEVLILHQDQFEAKDPAWVELELSSALSEKQRQKLASRSRRLRWRGVLVQLGVLVVLCGGLGLLLLGGRDDGDSEVAPPADPLDRVMATWSAVRESQGGNISEGSPELRVMIGRTDRFLYISNTSADGWPSMTVTINGPDGYVLRWEEVLRPGQTLNAPLREFFRGDEPLRNTPIQNVTIEVPGYLVWRHNFR